MNDTCICCGAPISEGRMVCWVCEHSAADVSCYKTVFRFVPGRKVIVTGKSGECHFSDHICGEGAKAL